MGNAFCAAMLWLSAGVALAVAQSPAPAAFEVASIRPSPPPETTPIVSMGSRPGGRWSAENVTVVDLLRYGKRVAVQRLSANAGRKSISAGRSVTGFQGHRGAKNPRVRFLPNV